MVVILKNIMNKKILNIIIPFFLLIILIPICLFIANFYNHDISNDIANWGAFGDYFGGILNSFFSFLTLIVTIYIAFEISKIEENRNKENLKFEREKLLRELREAEYKKINSELQKVWLSITEEDDMTSKRIIYNCLLQYRYFISSNYHLFPFFKDEEISNLNKSIQEIFDIIHHSKKLDKDEVIQNFTKNLDEFNGKIQSFLFRS